MPGEQGESKTNYQIIDSHTHVFPDKVVDRAMAALSAQYQAAPLTRPTVAGLLQHLDATGVDGAVICPVATRPDQVHSINRWIAGLTEERLIGFGALHPAGADLDDEIQFLIDHGIPGVKLQPHFQEFDLLSSTTLRMFEKIAGRLIVLLHAGQEIKPIDNVQPTPQRLRRLHESFPDMQLIVAHLGGYQMWDEAEEYLVGQDLYFDISYVFGYAADEQIARIIRNHGAQRMLFASDFPCQSPAEVLAGLDRLRLGPAERQMILAQNAIRLLQL